MPNISPSQSYVFDDRSKIEWQNISNGDTLEYSHFSARSGAIGCVQVTGDFGGGTFEIEVSNDGITFFPLSDIGGEIITSTTDAFFSFSTAALFVRPELSGGTGGNITVIVAGV